eukprot:5892605-Amphidinium_carterae.1
MEGRACSGLRMCLGKQFVVPVQTSCLALAKYRTVAEAFGDFRRRESSTKAKTDTNTVIGRPLYTSHHAVTID